MTGPVRNGEVLRVGRYELLAPLGVGGMGEVHLGRSPGGRLVAVKLVRPELATDPGFRRRFRDEVAAARKVGGFYTAQVVDADTDGTPPWLATAYIPGLSLQQAVAQHGPLPVGSVATLGAGLAEGLEAVHAQGLVHRDLKPANVILAEDGPRLIDFGIARALDATSYTQTHTVLGTAAFMSPEQATGGEVGTASDVFSLGCVLHFAATEVSPFGTGPAHAVAYRIVHDAPALGDLARLSPPLADLVSRCLAKDPGRRLRLDAVLDELAQLARPHGPAPRAHWLPDELARTITHHAEAVPPTRPAPPPDPSSTRQLTDLGAVSVEGQQPGPPRAVTPKRRVAVSVGISAGLLLLAVPALASAEGREVMAGFLDAMTRADPLALASLLFCAVSAAVNVLHLRRFAGHGTDRIGGAARVPLAVTGAVVGFLAPVPAFYALERLLAWMFGSESEDLVVVAGLVVMTGLLVALALHLRLDSPWQSHASAVVSLLLMALAVPGINALTRVGDDLLEGVQHVLGSMPRAFVVVQVVLAVAGAYLFVRQARRVVRPERIGGTVTELCSIVAGLVGLGVPFLALLGLAEFLDAPFVAVLGIAVLVAAAIGWRHEADKVGASRH